MEITKFYDIFEYIMMIFHTSYLFLLFIIFTTFLCPFSSYDISTKYSSILGPNLDKLPTQDKTIKLFQQWMKDHGRVYKDLKEMTKKFDIFLSNLKYITETNAKRKSPHDFFLGLNNFSDWNSQEFQEKYLHDIDMSMNNDMVNVNGVRDLSSCSDAPSSLDWNSKGAVTTVKNQNTCGSCWAFAAVGAIEGLNAIQTGKLIDFSEQQVLDCTVSEGCISGWVNKAFDWIISNQGIASANDYSYTSSKGDCKASQIQNNADSTISAYYHVEESDNGLLCAVAKQPISVCLYAPDDFHQYSHGIFDGPNCPVDSKDTNHCLLIVGYDSIDGVDYWILKNSWGTSWGMNGYMWMRRNTDKMYGVCAVNSWAYNPVK
ncbi:ervatamin-B-like [Trifolium pratense]|uniref:ervatamin-B-like n=1 Tax=Trifolium pratense TaxID=57577 RepID=UPI001E692CAB|nr:ervatamin-B-like [Trifolium pratense]